MQCRLCLLVAGREVNESFILNLLRVECATKKTASTKVTLVGKKKKMLILFETICWTWTMFFGWKFLYKFNSAFCAPEMLLNSPWLPGWLSNLFRGWNDSSGSVMTGFTSASLRWILLILNFALLASPNVAARTIELELCRLHVFVACFPPVWRLWKGNGEKKVFFPSPLYRRVRRQSCGAAYVHTKQLLAAHLRARALCHLVLHRPDCLI